MVDQPRYHGGRTEHRYALMFSQHVEDPIRVEGARHDDVVRTLSDVWQRVETRAVRQWSGMQFHVAIIEMVDVGVITVRHELKIAEGKNGSLGSTCGSAGIEQPGLVLRRADCLGDGLGRQ